MKSFPLQKHRFSILAFAISFLVLCVPVVSAQETPVVQQPSAPPPVKMITKEDRARIDAAKDSKARLRITIELAEGHLTDAEQRSSQEDYDAASASLGQYRALIEDALSFLGSLSRDHNKTRDLYKRLELALRAQGARLTAVRRNTPLEYAVWIKDLEEFARKGRTDALNSFYGNTVIKDPQPKVGDEKRSKNQKDNPQAPEN